MSGTHDHWGDVLVDRLIAEGRSLLTVDHRGVYRTAVPEAGYTIADLADDQAGALFLREKQTGRSLADLASYSFEELPF